MRTLIYVITGGSGFLGRHLTNILILFEPAVKEIRIYDTVIAEWVFELVDKCSVKITPIVGDVRNRQQLDTALESADVVFHMAAIIDVTGRFPRNIIIDVNVNGTNSVIDSCIYNRVRALVYTSSIEAVGPNTRGEDIINADENTSYSSFHNEPYPISKQLSEKHVIDANGILLAPGIQLSTCVLRPVGIYGEYSPILEMIYKKYRRRRVIYKCAPDEVMHSRVYVGNVAWMHVLAARHMIDYGYYSKVCKNIYYCYDDSPSDNYQRFNMNFLSDVGMRLETVCLPLWVIRVIAKINKGIQLLLSPWYTYTTLLNPHTLMMECTMITISTNKAFKDFGYTPLYAWEECKHRTSEWIKLIDSTFYNKT
ncbi:hydroxysteroid dehydrogenase [Turkeypox virus]|uniref:3 beta-hydroxysteroid dehydrogenase/Delta 5-->4-isomerase n=1 Tax=Turkeypox virus TaxID=336486 RepID=A0A0M3ZHF0_9POXV|nr:hydroxysteroid dehydrogenase [Turkeypox virus]ALA62398.2 hydroxysteroid dehydrogenase [Turkeypox virus]